MSKHWPPEKIIEGPWTRPETYQAPPRVRASSAVTLLLAALLVGGIAGLAWQRWPAHAPQQAATSAIEWDAVQQVPRRTPDAEDLAWQQRGASDDIAAPQAPASAVVRASFGYCKWGGGTNCVVDGDTFWIGGEKVRIAGIDAPETHPPRCAEEARLGDAATERLHALLNSGAVTMSSIERDRDRYGRLLRNVAVGGQDVGEAMIAAGVAREYGRGRRPWC